MFSARDQYISNIYSLVRKGEKVVYAGTIKTSSSGISKYTLTADKVLKKYYSRMNLIGRSLS